MFSSAFGTVTGLLDRRFVLGLLLPVLAFWAGVGALAATAYGWSRTNSWWQHLDTSRHVALTLAAVAGLVFVAIVLSTQVVPMTRILEGYWSWSWIDKTAGRFGRYRQGKRRVRLDQDKSPMGYLRDYLAFAPAELGPLMPTGLGNTLRAAESYPGDDERWGLDAVFWWPRLYLLLPDSVRDQVDEARTSMDQLVLLSVLSAAFAAAAIGFGIAGLNPAVWVSCTVGGLILARLSYLAAVAASTVFGDLVRSCFDLFRGDLLTHLGWPTPDSLPGERTLWVALGQQLYRRSASSAHQGLVNAPRQRPAPSAGADPGANAAHPDGS
jgi:hypothetical protein